MLPGDGRNLKLGKGAFMLDRLNPLTLALTGLVFVGNVSAGSMTSDTTKVEIFSSSQASAGLLGSVLTKRALAIALTCNEFTIENLRYWLSATMVTSGQTAATDATITIAAVVRGRFYPLNGARKVTGVTAVKGATPLVQDVDFYVNSEFGLFEVLPNSTVITADGTDSVTVTYDVPVIADGKIITLRIGTTGSQYARLVYLADDANTDGVGAHDQLTLWKVDVTPDGELNFISDDFGSFNLLLSVLSDGVNHPASPYGDLVRILP